MNQNKQGGFSLIELLVVVAIIAVLAVAGTYAYTRYIYSVKVAVNNTNAAEVIKALKAAAVQNDPKKLYELCGNSLASAPDYVTEVVPTIVPTPHNCMASLLADMKDPFAKRSYALSGWLGMPLFAPGPYSDPFQGPLSTRFTFPQITQAQDMDDGYFLVGNCASAIDTSWDGIYFWDQPDKAPFWINSHMIIFPMGVRFRSGEVFDPSSPIDYSYFGNEQINASNGWALVSCDDAGKATQILSIPSLFDWSQWKK
jgi:prepilin-type N-terminal cleavage/methylation domain-containing protein